MRLKRSWVLLCVIVTGILMGAGICRYSYLKDNKYTTPAHPTNLGILYLNETGYRENPFLYLVDGWEYYDGRLLDPDTVEEALPDDCFYIGKYAGFDFGNPEKSPYGCGTWRLHIVAGSQNREYALEIPQISSDWKIYINGTLRADSGNQVPAFAAAEHWMITFSAEGTIEIIIAVSSDHGIYSGFTYPPAFGSPAAVGQVLTHRLIFHCMLMVLSFIIGFVCVLAGLALRFQKPYYLLALLCGCFCLCVSYPLLQATGLSWEGWFVLERGGYYGLFLCVLLLQHRLCGLRLRYTMPVAVLGGLILLSILIQPFFPFETGAQKYVYSNLLGAFKWISASWILVTALIAAIRHRPYSVPMLGGVCVFACAVIYDRLYPLLEPIVFGWPVENAGFVLILIVAAILCYDTLEIYKSNLAMQSHLSLAKLREEALLESNRMKTQFLGNVSHELQTPMSIISGYAQMVWKEAWGEKIPEKDMICGGMRCILREGERASRLISQLLDVTQIESGNFTLDLEPVSVEELIQTICDTHLPVLNENGNEICLDIERNLPPMLWDGGRMEQVLLNLLRNACRHTKAGRICITGTQRNETVQIWISDTGEGIPEELLPHLFARYLSAKEHNAGRARGTGLGLYICNEIVKAHGGSITVQSKVGEGTAFCIELPLDGMGEELME